MAEEWNRTSGREGFPRVEDLICRHAGIFGMDSLPNLIRTHQTDTDFTQGIYYPVVVSFDSAFRNRITVLRTLKHPYPQYFQAHPQHLSIPPSSYPFQGIVFYWHTLSLFTKPSRILRISTFLLYLVHIIPHERLFMNRLAQHSSASTIHEVVSHSTSFFKTIQGGCTGSIDSLVC